MDGVRHPLPIMEEFGREWGTYLRFLTCSSDVGEDTQRDENADFRFNLCRLCGSARETKQHLVAECAKTREHAKKYFSEIVQVHRPSAEEAREVAEDELYEWIMGGGLMPYPLESDHSSIFRMCKSVRQPVKKRATIRVSAGFG